MFINAETFTSLQIIQTESHPNSRMQGPSKLTSGAKESLSIYGLFYHLASTPQGKQKLRQLITRPCLDLQTIEERLNTISALIRPENSSYLQKLHLSLKMIKDMRTVTLNLKKGISDVSGKGKFLQKGVWGSLQTFIFHTLKIFEATDQLSNKNTLAITTNILTQIHPIILNEVGALIADTIDFQTSAELHRTTILQGVDPELDATKRTYDGMESLLTQVANRLSAEVPEWASQYVENCIFFPQLGFLTAIPIDPETNIGKYEGEGLSNDVWKKMFVSNDTGYYKNRAMIEMDDYFGDLYGTICGNLIAPHNSVNSNEI